jgi:hypothetical protein
VRTHERIDELGAVESVQRIALPRPLVPATDRGARELGRRYWADVQRSTWGIVRVGAQAGGIDVRLAGVVALLRFGPARPRVRPEGVACSYDIVGGLLAARGGGALTVEQQRVPEQSLVLAVRGYHPRLSGRWRLVYEWLQAPLHRAIGRRFLGRATERRAA